MVCGRYLAKAMIYHHKKQVRINRQKWERLTKNDFRYILKGGKVCPLAGTHNHAGRCSSVTDKELKKLSRADLLELLLVQTRETESVKRQLLEAEKALEERQLRLTTVGSLAEAVLEVNGVMAAAQEAANQYLENIAAMEAEAKQRCESMIRAAQKEAQRILEDAHRKNVTKGDLK